MYKIIRSTALSPATAIIDCEDQVNLMVGNGGWKTLGGVSIAPFSEPSSHKTHFVACQALESVDREALELLHKRQK